MQSGKKGVNTVIGCLLSLIILLSSCAAPEQGTPPSDIPEQPAVSQEASEPNVSQEPFTYAETIGWDGRYDVIVVGFGGAGAAAAKAAADEGAGVLILEKAPQGHEGGNTKYSSQIFAYGNGDKEATMQYYKALGGSHEIPEPILKVFTESIADLTNIIAQRYGVDINQMSSRKGTSHDNMCPEYPEFPGGDKIEGWTVNGESGDGALWNLLRQNVVDRSDMIDIWFESPAVSLIQEPQTKAIIGVVVERDGQRLQIQANNGVVLACGGFENNPEMVETYLGLSRYAPCGTLYNTGDGIRMAMEVGADMWHMEAYEGIVSLGGSSFAVSQGERASLGVALPAFYTGSAVLVGGDGSRYLREDEQPRHGHTYYAGVWLNPKRPEKSYIVADQAQYDLMMERPVMSQELMDDIIVADTFDELAEKTGMNVETLNTTIANFNSFAKSGIDLQFGRSAQSMRAFGSGPYYAIEVIPNILNTQGGPRRNENAEVLDHYGKPIPQLYVAGELGGITSLQYQAGSNLAECMIFGYIAGKNAASAKAPIGAYGPLQKVESNPTYTLGVVSDVVSASTDHIQTGDNEYAGVGKGLGGNIFVKITMNGDVIEKVEIVEHSETEGISDPAIASLPDAIIAAQSADVDVVSGATMTSLGIMEAVKDALAKAS